MNPAKFPRRAGFASAVAMLLCCLTTAAQASDYRVTYRGVFSLGQDMPIADVAIASAAVSGANLTQLMLEASSERYPVVESLYPVRYRITSWLDADVGLVAFETFERTRDTRHRFYERDVSGQGMMRYDLLAGEGQDRVERLHRAPVASWAGERLFDRLALLAQLRSRDLRVGQRFSLPVTNGRDRMRYDISVESAASLMLQGEQHATVKVRLDAWELDARGRDKPAHRPAYIWLGDDRQRTPLMVEVRHPIGVFRAELVGADRQLALAPNGFFAGAETRRADR
ncbi:MAG: DUF3108 domain-containing protein [Gammaproteobacteria bacterium]|nr:DUF3108 domain-containing protein [Gammaproteobacteria bacterium]